MIPKDKNVLNRLYIYSLIRAQSLSAGVYTDLKLYSEFHYKSLCVFKPYHETHSWTVAHVAELCPEPQISSLKRGKYLPTYCSLMQRKEI